MNVYDNANELAKAMRAKVASTKKTEGSSCCSEKDPDAKKWLTSI